MRVVYRPRRRERRSSISGAFAQEARRGGKKALRRRRHGCGVRPLRHHTKEGLSARWSHQDAAPTIGKECFRFTKRISEPLISEKRLSITLLHTNHSLHLRVERQSSGKL